MALIFCDKPNLSVPLGAGEGLRSTWQKEPSLVRCERKGPSRAGAAVPPALWGSCIGSSAGSMRH